MPCHITSERIKYFKSTLITKKYNLKKKKIKIKFGNTCTIVCHEIFVIFFLVVILKITNPKIS